MPLNILPLLEKNVMVTTTYFSDYTTATNNNSNTKNKNKKLALTVSLAVIIVISSSLSFLVQITTLESVDAITDPDSAIEFNLVGGGGVIVTKKIQQVKMLYLAHQHSIQCFRSVNKRRYYQLKKKKIHQEIHYTNGR